MRQINTHIGNELFTDEKIVFNSIYLVFIMRKWSRLSPKTQQGLYFAKNYEEA